MKLIKPVNLSSSLLVKFAYDLTLSILINQKHGSSLQEVENILEWANINRMKY
jgi:hypothetical protein